MNLSALAGEISGEISIAALRCRCGSPDVVAIDPGNPPVIDVETDKMLSRGRPVGGRCMACLLAPRKPARRPLECWRCAGTEADGLAFDRKRKPRGRPLLCTDCAADSVPGRPVFVARTYARHAAARAVSPQMDIDELARRAP